jgi:hypothetical protein
MRPSTRAVTLAALALMGAACASSSEEGVTGIVVDVQGDLDNVEQFTVLVEGEQMVFETTTDADYAFPAAHLRDHLRSGEPVQVRWEQEDDRRVAVFIDDG